MTVSCSIEVVVFLCVLLVWILTYCREIFFIHCASCGGLSNIVCTALCYVSNVAMTICAVLLGSLYTVYIVSSYYMGVVACLVEYTSVMTFVHSFNLYSPTWRKYVLKEVLLAQPSLKWTVYKYHPSTEDHSCIEEVFFKWRGPTIDTRKLYI